jgi:flagellin FlaB
MNKQKLQRFLRQKRGIVGIEAAIVLIAFVVIAAALAYVVINMGFYSSQKAKSTIDKGIQEATSALELDGFIIGYTTGTSVQYLAVPLKLAVGQEQVDMASNTVVVAVFGTNFALSDIYSNASYTTTESNMTKLMLDTGPNSNATCYLFNDDGDTVLEQNEKAYMVVNLGDDYTLGSYSKVKVEIRTSRGAALMVQREIPGGLPADSQVDLG